jgi:hypothetical protein
MGPIFWVIALVVIFLILDEGQRLRRRVKALEDRLERLEPEGGARAPDGGLLS